MSERRLLTTGVGSVPFTDAEAAVEHVFRHYTLPFFPQVVKVSGAPAGLAPMLWELLTPAMAAACVRRDEAALADELARATAADAAQQVASLPGLGALLARLGAWAPVKTQLAGPETLLALALPARPEAAREAAWCWCERLTDAWVATLRTRTSGPVLIVWDEGLSARGGEAARGRVRALQRRLASESVSLGFHTCAAVDVAELAAQLPGAVLSVDAHVSSLLTPAGLQTAQRHAARDARLWLVGAVDTRPGRALRTPSATALASLAPLTLALSGGCGTGLLSIDDERAVASRLTTLADTLARTTTL